MYNPYGPSEDTTYSTYMELEKGVMHRVPPIGKPIFNTEVYVLSAEQKMVPIGVVGELRTLVIRISTWIFKAP
ncbi:AMP-binding protein [Bacillus cereus]